MTTADDDVIRSSRAHIVDEFHRLWYETGQQGVWSWTTWLGRRIAKFPGDLLVYQEILCETEPDLVIETGTLDGGSALYLATVMDALGRGRVVSVDVAARPGRPQHPRVEYLTASSTTPAIVESLQQRAQSAQRVMVLLDSDHAADHVAAELEAYASLVTPGCYLIVEDTNVNGHPVLPDHGPGPMEAVHGFLAAHPEFVVDESRERLLMTFNPNGYLRRVGESPPAAPPDTEPWRDVLEELTERERAHEARLQTLTLQHQELQEQLEEERQRGAKARYDLDALRQTRLFRYSAPWRRLYARLRYHRGL